MNFCCERIRITLHRNVAALESMVINRHYVFPCGDAGKGVLIKFRFTHGSFVCAHVGVLYFMSIAAILPGNIEI